MPKQCMMQPCLTKWKNSFRSPFTWIILIESYTASVLRVQKQVKELMSRRSDKINSGGNLPFRTEAAIRCDNCYQRINYCRHYATADRHYGVAADNRKIPPIGFEPTTSALGKSGIPQNPNVFWGSLTTNSDLCCQNSLSIQF
jgi:hypothetical protein